MFLECLVIESFEDKTNQYQAHLNVLNGEIFDIEKHADLSNNEITSKTATFSYEQQVYEFDVIIDEHNIVKIADYDSISLFENLRNEYYNSNDYKKNKI